MVNTDSWLYKSGDIWLPNSVVKMLDTYIVGNDKSSVYLNYWHINHFLSGVMFGLFQIFFYRLSNPIFTYLVLHTLWEIWQLLIGMTPLTRRGFFDILIDTSVGLLGYLLVIPLERKQ